VRRKLARLAVLVVPFALLAMVTVPAYAFFGDKLLASGAPQHPCMDADGAVGDTIVGDTSCVSTGGSEHATTSAAIVCTDHSHSVDYVTADCPFTPGLNLNSDFAGSIIEYGNMGDGVRWKSNFNGLDVLQASSTATGDPEEWVQVGNCADNNYDCVFISVGASNALGLVNHYEGVCSGSTDFSNLKLEEDSGGGAANCGWRTQ
jgi:hypothetical protein